MEEKASPKTSIIITTYNRSQILAKRSLPSCLEQTYPNFECIVVDDCSTDNTQKVVEGFKNREGKIKYYKLSKNSGVSAARNYGVKKAKGEFIAFLDDDDAYLPNFLEVTVPKLNELPESFGAVTGGRIIIHKNSREYGLPSISNSFYCAIDDNWLLRKEVFSKISYDEEIDHDDDIDFGIQFFRLYKAYAINQPLLLKHVFRRKSKKVYLHQPRERRIAGLNKFLEKNLSAFKERGSKNDLAFIYRFAGRNYCCAGKMKKGIICFWRSFLVKPTPRIFFNLAAASLGPVIYRLYWDSERTLAQLVRCYVTRKVKKSLMSSSGSDRILEASS